MARAVRLLVRSPFEGREEGSYIEDAAEVRAVLAGPHAAFVIPVAVPDEAATPTPPTPRRVAVNRDAKE